MVLVDESGRAFCEDCRIEVKAAKEVACPHCGYPIEKHNKYLNKDYSPTLENCMFKDNEGNIFIYNKDGELREYLSEVECEDDEAENEESGYEE